MSQTITLNFLLELWRMTLSLGWDPRHLGGGCVGVIIYCALLQSRLLSCQPYTWLNLFSKGTRIQTKSLLLGQKCLHRDAKRDSVSLLLLPAFPSGYPPFFLTPCSCRITTTSLLIVSDQTRQIGRRMVSQGNLGHRDGKGAEENIMAWVPLKHADSWQMSIHKMTKASLCKALCHQRFSLGN